MFLPTKEKNKYTIGKQLRKNKLLRKKDQTCTIVEMPSILN